MLASSSRNSTMRRQVRRLVSLVSLALFLIEVSFAQVGLTNMLSISSSQKCRFRLPFSTLFDFITFSEQCY